MTAGMIPGFVDRLPAREGPLIVVVTRGGRRRTHADEAILALRSDRTAVLDDQSDPGPL
jgi:hypothetical protein